MSTLTRVFDLVADDLIAAQGELNRSRWGRRRRRPRRNHDHGGGGYPGAPSRVGERGPVGCAQTLWLGNGAQSSVHQRHAVRDRIASSRSRRRSGLRRRIHHRLRCWRAWCPPRPKASSSGAKPNQATRRSSTRWSQPARRCNARRRTARIYRWRCSKRPMQQRKARMTRARCVQRLVARAGSPIAQRGTKTVARTSWRWYSRRRRAPWPPKQADQRLTRPRTRCAATDGNTPAGRTRPAAA